MTVQNHPLIGQRVRITGMGWSTLARGEVHLIEEVDHEGDVVFGAGLYYANVTDSGDDYAGEVVRTIYGSRPRNVDPLPYVDGHTDAAGNPRRFAEPYHVNGDGTDCQWCVTRYAPRPEYDAAPIHPVNPILAHFRYVAGSAHTSETARWMVHSEAFSRPGQVPFTPDPYTDEHVEHARRVIERLARL